MKIAIIATGPTIDSPIATQTDRDENLLIVDPATMKFEKMKNPLVAIKGPTAGKSFAQLLLRNGVNAVLIGDSNFDMLKELGIAGIRILVGITGSVRNAVNLYKDSYCPIAS